MGEEHGRDDREPRLQDRDGGTDGRVDQGGSGDGKPGSQQDGSTAGRQSDRQRGQPGTPQDGQDAGQQADQPRGRQGAQPGDHPGDQQGGQPGARQKDHPGGPDTPGQDEQEADASDDERPAADSWLSRRRALASAGLLGVGAIGYTLVSIWNEPNAPVPRLPTQEMEANGWVRTNQSKEQAPGGNIGPVTVTALRNRVDYGNQGLLDRVRAQDVTLEVSGSTFTRPLTEVAPNAVEQYLAIFVATRVDLGPDVDNMPLGLGREEVMNNVGTTARSSFVQTMEDTGLENVEGVEATTLDVETGESADLFTYAGDFPIEGGTFTEAGEEFTIPSSSVSMTGYLAVWHHRDWVMIGAGAHPDENYRQSFDQELSTGQTATITIDLGLTPSAYREEMLGYMRRMK
jgi:hypothetical protein